MEQRRSTNQNQLTAVYYFSFRQFTFHSVAPSFHSRFHLFFLHDKCISPQVQHGFTDYVQKKHIIHVQGGVMSLACDLCSLRYLLLQSERSSGQAEFVHTVVCAALKAACKGRSLISLQCQWECSRATWRLGAQPDNCRFSVEVFLMSILRLQDVMISSVKCSPNIFSLTLDSYCTSSRHSVISVQSKVSLLHFPLLGFPRISHCGSQGSEGAKKKPTGIHYI